MLCFKKEQFSKIYVSVDNCVTANFMICKKNMPYTNTNKFATFIVAKK